jgi:tetratricopeptide (TPR) repeat protein
MSSATRRRLSSIVIFCAVLLQTAIAGSQTDATRDAERLRDTGDLAGAARLLQAHLVRVPDDANAQRLLAHTLYWMQDVAGAKAAYDLALRWNPDDERTRLEYARLLGETGDRRSARDVLAPLRNRTGGHAAATALLGTLAYWDGDLIAAERHMLEAIRLNPDQADARRELSEIRTATSPWVRATGGLWQDDQPLDRRSGGMEAGAYLTPLTPVRARIQPAYYTAPSPIRTTWGAEFDVRHLFAPAGVETELAGGMLRREEADRSATQWTGRAMVGVRLPGFVTVRGRAEQLAYLYTLGSLASPVDVRSVAGELQLNHPNGWLAQAALQQQRFTDDNVVRSAYAWLLAPIVRTGSVDLQAGYAVSNDDARESRYFPVILDGSAISSSASRSRSGARVVQNTSAPLPASGSVEGRYVPYYTPEQVVRHAAIAAITARLSPEATIRLAGSRAIHAEEQAPVFVPAGTGWDRAFTLRRFSPWDLRGSLDLRTNASVTINLTAETGGTAFYRWTTAGMAVTYRFSTRVLPASRIPSMLATASVPRGMDRPPVR